MRAQTKCRIFIMLNMHEISCLFGWSIARSFSSNENEIRFRKCSTELRKCVSFVRFESCSRFRIDGIARCKIKRNRKTTLVRGLHICFTYKHTLTHTSHYGHILHWWLYRLLFTFNFANNISPMGDFIHTISMTHLSPPEKRANDEKNQQHIENRISFRRYSLSIPGPLFIPIR